MRMIPPLRSANIRGNLSYGKKWVKKCLGCNCG
jgi:hypothetical protein